MGYAFQMLLEDYLKQEDISVTRFARLAGFKSRSTVYRYIGSDRRVPDPDAMLQIFYASHGHVTPNDFYDLRKRRKTQ